MSELASVGCIRRAHGIRGELVVELLTDTPDAVFAPGCRLFAGTAAAVLWRDPETGSERELTVRSSRPFKDGLLITFDGIADRTEAERWRGRHLLAPFSELVPPDAGEVYLHELEGMRVVDASGADVGLVSAWNRLPNGILLEIAGGRGTVHVPFNEAFVRVVDRAARRLTIEIPDELYPGGA
ncbi:MAG: ribosome maturation factor RimM [Gemmatimonadales bacterium]